MKFKQYLALIRDKDGFIPTPNLRWVIRKNDRATAREEAIAASIIEQANPRENITGHYGWDKEEQLVLQQMWINPSNEYIKFVDVPIQGAEDLYTTEDTKYGPMPVPNAIKAPGTIVGNFHERLDDILGKDYQEDL